MNWIDYRLAVKVWFGLVKGDFRMFNSFKVSIADMLHDVHHSGRGSLSDDIPTESGYAGGFVVIMVHAAVE